MQELDYQQTPIGELVLRRRRFPQTGDLDVFEVKLGDEFLMSSLFFEAEWQLSKLGLAALDRDGLDVVVGGLGLGYTAASALEDARVSSLVVVEYLEPVIGWHQQGLVPLGTQLSADPRCRFVHADFFALAQAPGGGFEPGSGAKRYDAVLLDIDHTHSHLLDEASAPFYATDGLMKLAGHLKPDGVFAMWADGVPHDGFADRLARVFAEVSSHRIEFPNPLAGGVSTGAVYVARQPRRA
jgi:spermidine synthase